MSKNTSPSVRPSPTLVAVDHELVERRAGGAAVERDLNHVRLAVVAGRLFEVDRAQQHVRRDVARHQSASLERLDLAAAGTAAQPTAFAASPPATSGRRIRRFPKAQLAERSEYSHELPPCTLEVGVVPTVSVEPNPEGCASDVPHPAIGRPTAVCRRRSRFQIRSVVS